MSYYFVLSTATLFISFFYTTTTTIKDLNNNCKYQISSRIRINYVLLLTLIASPVSERKIIWFIKTDLKLSSNKEKGYFSYSGAVKTEEFELGNMLANDQLGKVTFNLKVEGNHYEKQYPSIVMKGLIASIDYSDYNYENITLDGEYKQGGFNGKIALDDENGSVR